MAKRRMAFVIGAGVAGIEAGRGLAEAGWRVVTAEPGPIGGTCVWAGCIPKKAMWESARVLQLARNGPEFGIGAQDAPVDWADVLAWERQTEREYAGDQEAIMRSYGIEHVPRPARFVSPEEVEAGGDTYRPDAVIVATGSRTVMPKIPGIQLAGTSSNALTYPHLPESLVIAGGGYIGMEFAAVYASFGTRITLIQHGSRVLPPFDADAVAVAVSRLRSLGVEFLTGARVTSISGTPGDVRVRYSKGGRGDGEASGERVLMAVGRRPEVEQLDAEAGAVETDEQGRIRLDADQRTTNPRVWVAGDAAGTMMICPAAYYAARVVVRSILTGEPTPTDYSAIPSTVFTDPPVAVVGLTEEKARATGVAYEVRRFDFAELGAAVVADKTAGLVKLLFAKGDGRLIGGHVAGPTADDLIYPIALAMRNRNTAAHIAETIGIHAAYCEAINFAALSEPS